QVAIGGPGLLRSRAWIKSFLYGFGGVVVFKRHWLYGFWLLGLCLALGLLDAFRSYSAAYYDGNYYLAWTAALRSSLSGWLIWIPFIPLVLWLSDRLRVNRENWLARMLFYVPLGLLLSLIRTFFPILIYLVFVSNYSTLISWLRRKPYFLLTDFLFALVF